MSSDEHPLCPCCNYDREGIAVDAPCPECGAEGFDGALVICGQPDLQLRLWMRIFVVAAVGFVLAFAMIPVVISWKSIRLMAPTSPPPATVGIELADLICTIPLGIAAAVIAVLIIRARQRTFSAYWSFHPRGVLVVEGLKRTFIPRETIVRVTTVDLMSLNVSQLAIHRTTDRVHHLQMRIPVIRIAGTSEERRAIFRSTAPFDPSRSASV